MTPNLEDLHRDDVGQGSGMRLGIVVVMVMAPLLGWAQGKSARLTGIVYWQNTDTAQAVLELPSTRGVPMRPILREGDALGGYSVKRIGVQSGTVELLLPDGDTQVLDLGLDPGEQLAGRTLYLRGTDLRQVLQVYQEFSGRTVIQSGALPITKIDCKSRADASPKLAVEILTESLTRAAFVLKPIGEKFVVAGTERDDERIRLIAQPPQGTVVGEEVFPPGLIKLQDVDCVQVLDIYAELAGRILIRGDHLQPEYMNSGKVTVRSQTPLERREARWLLESALLMAGISIVPEGEKFTFVLPAGRRFEPPRFDPDKTKPLAAEPVRLKDINGQQLVEAYARLTGREAMTVPPEVSRRTFYIRASTPLAAAEAIYALRAMAAVNGFDLQAFGEKHVELVRTNR